jgi:hypothetical protein
MTCSFIENFAGNFDDNNYSVTFAVNSFGIVLGKDDDGVRLDAVYGELGGLVAHRRECYGVFRGMEIPRQARDDTPFYRHSERSRGISYPREYVTVLMNWCT